MLRRKFYNTLLKWSKEKNQECLLVRGARQIGKTYIIDYFEASSTSVGRH